MLLGSEVVGEIVGDVVGIQLVGLGEVVGSEVAGDAVGSELVGEIAGDVVGVRTGIGEIFFVILNIFLTPRKI